jgi:hypothetical protein
MLAWFTVLFGDAVALSAIKNAEFCNVSPPVPSARKTALSTAPVPDSAPPAVAYSNAVAPALTLNTCNAVPSAVSPVPPFATVTVSDSVDPAAVTVMLAEPSKLTPLIVLAVCRIVADPAFPLTLD